MSGTRARAKWHDAHRLCFSVASALDPEQVRLADAVGRILSEDVIARCDVPHYAASAMDGWAVAGAPPWRLVDEVALVGGQAQPIVTGGLVPPGTFAVVRSEHGSQSGEGEHARVTLHPGANAGTIRANENIRAIGEEIRKSETVIRSGTLLNPAHLALAAVSGHDTLSVRRVPRVHLILTGDEVVSAGIPAPGFVRDVFGPMLPTLVGTLGGTVTAQHRIGDDLQASVSAIADASTDADVIITTGGTSRSEADHLHGALAALQADLLLDGVAMRPGGPSLLARLEGGRFLIGLPGNPLAAVIGMLSLARPLVCGLSGSDEPHLGATVSGCELSPVTGHTRLIPYRSVEGLAHPTDWLGSGMLRGLADADGILLCPPIGVSRGERVETIPLPW
jgi:molybdopterin molybdotransferase